MTEIRAAMVDRWKVSRARRPRFDAVIDHAMAFETLALARERRPPDRDVVDLLVALVRRVADGSLSDERPRADAMGHAGRPPNTHRRT